MPDPKTEIFQRIENPHFSLDEKWGLKYLVIKYLFSLVLLLKQSNSQYTIDLVDPANQFITGCFIKIKH